MNGHREKRFVSFRYKIRLTGHPQQRFWDFLEKYTTEVEWLGVSISSGCTAGWAYTFEKSKFY